jgi:hypothetical protein
MSNSCAYAFSDTSRIGARQQQRASGTALEQLCSRIIQLSDHIRNDPLAWLTRVDGCLYEPRDMPGKVVDGPNATKIDEQRQCHNSAI